MFKTTAFACAVSLVSSALVCAQEKPAPNADLATGLRKLESRVIVLGAVREPPLAPMLARDARAALRAANEADAEAWEKVKSRADWERFRDARVQSLRAALGQFPPAPKTVKVRVTRSLEGDGYRVDNLVYESRPGLVVTANLYRPAKAAPAMPGILLSHSHHQPKHTSARQDMGMTWARAGCLVLAPDHLCHGERRQHPFRSAADYPQKFLLPQQDYYSRYDAGMQLDLIGDSLMGWLAWDMSRGIDVLLAQAGVDPKRIIVVSEPSGGGDNAAVTAALDPRITGVVVTNFGGPQPETPYPLPADAERSFEYAGSGSWESTRNLRLSARDGFMPWTIVAATAPRRVVYNHEFYWDRDNDPVWKRLEKVYRFYDAADAVTGVAGRGFVVGSEPENTHWIPESRELLYPVFERWFGIANPKKEYSKRRPIEDLLCLTPEALKEFQATSLHELAGRIGTERSSRARAELARLRPEEARAQLRRDWTRLLGAVSPKADAAVAEVRRENLGDVTVERVRLSVEPGIVVPVVLLMPPQTKGSRLPVVLGVGQGGKHEFLRQRADVIVALLAGGVAVCLPDVRGTGETSPGDARERRSPATSLSATALMFGRPMLGARLRDLRSVLRYVRQHPELDGARIALWGDSFIAPNADNQDLRVPHGIDGRPTQAEPLGGLLALFGALFDEDIRAVYVQGGLSGYLSALQGPFCFLPHDVIVPSALTAGDLCDVAAALAPRPLRLEGLVDAMNRRVTGDSLEKTYEPTRKAYPPQRFDLEAKPAPSKPAAPWLLERLKG
jgi:dienelactone hydrolase